MIGSQHVQIQHLGIARQCQRQVQPVHARPRVDPRPHQSIAIQFRALPRRRVHRQPALHPQAQPARRPHQDQPLAALATVELRP